MSHWMPIQLVLVRKAFWIELHRIGIVFWVSVDTVYGNNGQSSFLDCQIGICNFVILRSNSYELENRPVQAKCF